MSQQKVDRYKEQKAKRKELVEKERKQRKVRKGLAIALTVVILGLISGAIGLTAYNEYKEYQANLPDYTAAGSMIVDDLAGVLDADTAEE